MEQLQLTQVPTVKTGMLIRKPVGEVFRAVIDPDITTKFWFTKSSGPLQVGKQIRWDWEMYDASTQVTVQRLEPDKRIAMEWDGYSGRTSVEWVFTQLKDGTTFVAVSEAGFSGSGDDLLKYVANSTQGFSLVLAGMKAFLEHGVKLNLTADRYAKGVPKHLAA